MKKIYTNFYIVVILFASYNIINASCPWLPSGYSSTPSWQSALSNKIKITNDCWLIYEYCWRVNSSGQKEIIIGSIRTEGSTPWYMFSSCLNELNKRKEMMLDKAIAQIVLESQKFGATTLLPCPNYGNNVYRVTVSSCLSDWYFDWSENNGNYVRKPCNSTGYCAYEYKFCVKIDPITQSVQGSAYTRSIIQNSNYCDDQYYNENANIWINCFAENCYPDRLNPLKLVTDEIMSDPMIDDTNFYLNYEW